MTPDDIRAWPATVDVVTAFRAFGLGRDAAYAVVKRGTAPVTVLRVGRRLRVTRASVMTALGIGEVAP